MGLSGTVVHIREPRESCSELKPRRRSPRPPSQVTHSLHPIRWTLNILGGRSPRGRTPPDSLKTSPGMSD